MYGAPSLETNYCRDTFTDSHWRNSCEYVIRVAVSLASCVAPFSEDPHLPLEHSEALSLVVRLAERCRELDGGLAANGGAGAGAGAGLHSSLKYCIKKNGLGRAAGEVSERAFRNLSCSFARAGVQQRFCEMYATTTDGKERISER